MKLKAKSWPYISPQIQHKIQIKNKTQNVYDFQNP